MNNLVTTSISEYINQHASLENKVSIWQEPLVRFADVDDPLFPRLKEIISSTHATPRELLPSAKTVIVYFLPFKKEIPKSNRTGELASEEWAAAYVRTNKLIIALNKQLSILLQKSGFVSRVLPPTHNFDTESLISDWSHKHVAYIAGLGNFGYHHQLITEKGCCGRLGSIITEVPLVPSQRNVSEFCLNRYDNSCKVCSQRCPVQAISDFDFIRHDCYDVLLKNEDKYEYLGMADVCGKCSSMVPCSFLNPVRKKVKKTIRQELRLEKAEQADLALLLDLQKVAYQSEADRYHDPELPPLVQTIEDLQQEFETHIFLKAVLHDKIIGSVRACIEGETCHISKLNVHPDFLQVGIGSRLMREIEVMMAGVQRFELFTGHLTTPALNLYLSMGYQEFKRKKMITHELVFLEKQGAVC